MVSDKEDDIEKSKVVRTCLEKRRRARARKNGRYPYISTRKEEDIAPDGKTLVNEIWKVWVDDISGQNKVEEKY